MLFIDVLLLLLLLFEQCSMEGGLFFKFDSVDSVFFYSVS